VTDIITVVLGFLTICSGITLLQMSKIDPEDLKNKVGVDRRSTMLLAATRANVEPTEKHTEIEDPGMDAIRGGAGIIGSIYRARSMNKSASGDFESRRRKWHRRTETEGTDAGSTAGLARHQLYDRPLSSFTSDKFELADDEASQSIALSPLKEHVNTIGFVDDVTAHRYPQTGRDVREATHEHEALHPSHSQLGYQNNAPIQPHAPSLVMDRTGSRDVYRDPFRGGSSTPSGVNIELPRSSDMPRQPSATSAAQSFSKKLSVFQTNPDLSLADPRASEKSTRSKRSLFSPTLRSQSSRRGSKDPDEEEERSHLVLNTHESRESLDGLGHIDQIESEGFEEDLGRQMEPRDAWRR